jgi:hypothetical protein
MDEELENGVGPDCKKYAERRRKGEIPGGYTEP